MNAEADQRAGRQELDRESKIGVQSLQVVDQPHRTQAQCECEHQQEFAERTEASAEQSFGFDQDRAVTERGVLLHQCTDHDRHGERHHHGDAPQVGHW